MLIRSDPKFFRHSITGHGDGLYDSDQGDFYFLVIFGTFAVGFASVFLSAGVFTLLDVWFMSEFASTTGFFIGVAVLIAAWLAYCFGHRYCTYNQLSDKSRRVVDRYLKLSSSQQREYRYIYDLAAENQITQSHYCDFNSLIEELQRRERVTDVKRIAAEDRQAVAAQRLKEDLKLTREINQEML